MKVHAALREISKAEQLVCEHLREVIAEISIGEAFANAEDLRDLLGVLEWFISEVIHEVHPRADSLDGVYAKVARRTGERAVEIVGLACLMDQSLTPLHVSVESSVLWDHVVWIDCRLGENTKTGMRREPYRSSKINGAMLHVAERLNSIDWFYHVGCGERTD